MVVVVVVVVVVFETKPRLESFKEEVGLANNREIFGWNHVLRAIVGC